MKRGITCFSTLGKHHQHFYHNTRIAEHIRNSHRLFEVDRLLKYISCKVIAPKISTVLKANDPIPTTHQYVSFFLN